MNQNCLLKNAVSVKIISFHQTSDNNMRIKFTNFDFQGGSTMRAA